jgi:hypothetical protein
MTNQKSVIIINTWKFPVSLYYYSRFLLALSDNIKIIDLTDDVIGHGVKKDIKTFLHSFANINIIYKLNNINRLWDKIIHGFPLMFFRRLVSVLSP